MARCRKIAADPVRAAGASAIRWPTSMAWDAITYPKSRLCRLHPGSLRAPCATERDGFAKAMRAVAVRHVGRRRGRPIRAAHGFRRRRRPPRSGGSAMHPGAAWPERAAWLRRSASAGRRALAREEDAPRRRPWASPTGDALVRRQYAGVVQPDWARWCRGPVSPHRDSASGLPGTCFWRRAHWRGRGSDASLFDPIRSAHRCGQRRRACPAESCVTVRARLSSHMVRGGGAAPRNLRLESPVRRRGTRLDACRRWSGMGHDNDMTTTE